jgi:hypothetical protein
VKLQFLLAMVQLAQGHPAQARLAVEKEPALWYRLTGIAIVADAQGQRAESDIALAELERTYATSSAVQVAEVFAHRRDRDAAFEWLGRAFTQRDAGLRWLKVDPLFDSLRADPRYRALLKRLKLS